MWFIGVEVEQETSAPPPKKFLDSPLYQLRRSSAVRPRINTQRFMNTFKNRLIFHYNLSV